MKSVLIVLMCLLAALELFALVFATSVLSRGISGVDVLSVLIAVLVPLVGLFGVVTVYRRQRGMG